MPKNKRPVPRKPNTPPPEDDEVLAQALADLALDITGHEGEEHRAVNAAGKSRKEEFAHLVRNALRKKNDEVLYGAIELARFADVAAYQYLRSEVEEAAATVILRREGAPAMEINAFAIPLFVHSRGGLKQDQCFQDDEAFAQLVDSFRQGGLESERAKVIVVSHAYDGAEANRITFSQMNDMLREAAASMQDKKLAAAPALERSIVGWTPSGFGPDDQAVELRYLLGFALKRADDPFYMAPRDPIKADAWYEARMARYRTWTEGAAPLIKRCLTTRPDEIELHFLYQDLYFGALEQGRAELDMLGMMSDLNGAIAAYAGVPGELKAIVAPAVEHDEMELRVQLLDAAGQAIVTSARPLDVAADLQGEVEDVCDALTTLGISSISVAQRFDADGTPVDARPWSGA